MAPTADAGASRRAGVTLTAFDPVRALSERNDERVGRRKAARTLPEAVAAGCDPEPWSRIGVAAPPDVGSARATPCKRRSARSRAPSANRRRVRQPDTLDPSPCEPACGGRPPVPGGRRRGRTGDPGRAAPGGARGKSGPEPAKGVAGKRRTVRRGREAPAADLRQESSRNVPSAGKPHVAAGSRTCERARASRGSASPAWPPRRHAAPRWRSGRRPRSLPSRRPASSPRRGAGAAGSRA